MTDGMMITKKELPHFQIERFYGGSQTWLMDPWMRLGGCGALAAVDSCIFLSKHHRLRNLYPAVHRLNRSSYRTFAMEMKPFLRPRYQGINKLYLYVDGFQQYLDQIGFDRLHMTEYAMGGSKEEAWELFKKQIDDGMLVPVLLLNPISKEWQEYQWHWFLLNGYEITENGHKLVKVVTYGEYEWLSWDGFWDEKDKDNGGMILYSIDK